MGLVASVYARLGSPWNYFRIYKGRLAACVLFVLVLVLSLQYLGFKNGVNDAVLPSWRKEISQKYWSTNSTWTTTNVTTKTMDSIEKIIRARIVVHHNKKTPFDERTTKLLEENENDTKEKFERNFISIDKDMPDQFTPREFLNVTYENITQKEAPAFLPHYKNPCWFEHHPDDTPPTLHCLPYFYIAGFPKCGTTDLYFKMIRHPQVALVSSKEPHWWTRRRFAVDANSTTFNFYLKYFANAADKIEHSCSSPDCEHRIITGDSSASTFWDNQHWHLLPGNNGLAEPKVITASHIYHITPKAKIIIILRNPIDRLYSDYIYFNNPKTTSPKSFHSQVMLDMGIMAECLRNRSARSCAYNYRQLEMKLRLYIGLYSVYLEDWLTLFPKNQILTIMSEEYSQNRTIELEKIYSFLGLESQPPSFYEEINSLKDKNTQTKRYKRKGYMFEETRTLLHKFYEPYNRELSELLDDQKYITQWSEDIER